MSCFEARAGLQVLSLLARGPLLAPQSMRVPFVPWGLSQGQHFINLDMQLIIGLDS